MRYLVFYIFLLSVSQLAAQNTSIGTSTLIQVEGGAVLYFGGSATLEGSLTNEGSTIVESDVQVIGAIDNSGNLLIKGDGALDINAQINNSTGADLTIEGNANINGDISNDGELLISGDLNSVVNGIIINTNELDFDTDVQLNGTIDNIGLLDITGEATVDGTLLNPVTGTTSVDGDLTLNTDFINEGILTVSGETSITNAFTNDNEASFNGIVSFNGITNNTMNLTFGSNAIFNGDFTNTGGIIGFADAELNFVNNRFLGDLSFMDRSDLQPISEVILLSSADSTFINNLILDTEGKVSLPSNIVLVQGSLTIENGVLNATNQESFLVEGSINVNPDNAASTFVEGKMLASTSSGETVFPMGINGLPNYIAIISETPDIVVKVECKKPDLDSLFTNDETLGLAKEVVWTIQTLSDSVEVEVAISYSGIDFTDASNFVNAREYDATVQKFGAQDSLFYALRSIETEVTNSVDLFGISVPESGSITTSDKLWVTTKPTVFAIGLSPVLTQPEVYLPNVFAPNGQFADNTIFRPFVGGTTIVSVDFAVFDSFNKKVYASSLSGEDIDLESIGWDGTLNSGLEAPEGVYYYSLSMEYTANAEVSVDYFNGNGGSQVQNFSKLGTVMLVK